MDVSPNASVPGAGALDDVYSRIGIRPICSGPTKHARRHPGHREGRLRLGSGGRHCHLETAASTGQRTAITDQAGSFRFSAVEPGNYKITIAASGFAVWTRAERGGRFER